MKKNKVKAIKSLRDVKRERLRLEYELMLITQQLKIRSLELQNQFHMDRLLFFFFKKALSSVFGRIRQTMAERKGEKRQEQN